MTESELLTFIKSKSLAVIATCDKAQPESAVIGFGQTDTLELIFGTYKTSRKYQNLHQNNSVSVVIGWDGGQTVQYEGKAFEIAEEEKVNYVPLYLQKNPTASRYSNHPDQSYWRIKPDWIRYSDISTNPEQVIEFNLKERE